MSQEPPVQTEVLIVFTQPRLTFTDHMLCLMNLAARTGWPNVFHGGAFWDQSITGCIKEALRLFRPKYLFFVDFDTVMEPEIAFRLKAYLDGRPDLTAVFATQMSRHDDRPLCFRPDLPYETEELTIQPAGHFGATMIRAEVFDKLEKPWFWGMPDPDGEWSQIGKTDPDIWFWKLLEANGFKVAQANQCVVGHMELCVKWPTTRGHCYQPVRHYGKAGAPPLGFDWDKYRKSYLEANERRAKEHIEAGGSLPPSIPLPDFKANPEPVGV